MITASTLIYFFVNIFFSNINVSKLILALPVRLQYPNLFPELMKFHFHICRPLHLLLLILFFCCSIAGNMYAQLQANFTASKAAGCSPLSVAFSNTTTGASAAAKWQWSLGNGNSSTLKEPGATYFTENQYTVTLTVTDGAATSSKSMTVTVYKKPTVDFSVSPPKGCTPLPVNFTSSTTAGDGTVSNYLWDFGDGSTIQGAGYATAAHTYTLPGTMSATLNVTNSFGCYTTLTKAAVVEVVIGITPIFIQSATTLCKAGESVTFTNSSTGSGNLSYKWDFGDGKMATDASPAHVYASSGSFTPAVTITSSDGCAVTKAGDKINVANFIADFDIPAKICGNDPVSFINKSTRPFDRAEWRIDDSYSYGNYDGNLTAIFYQEGEHTVALVSHYGGCTDTVTKKVTVLHKPVLAGFIADLQGACGVPLKINFKDTSAEATTWLWRNYYFDNGFATIKNASFNYTSGDYSLVYLTIGNAAGCSSTVSKYVYYAKPSVYIGITSTTGYEGCAGLTVSFAANPDTALKDFKWNFGDGTPVSTERTPTHTFNKGGNFTVTLEYVSNSGCKGSVNYYSVNVIDRPKFDFVSKSGTTVCGNTPDTFAVTPAGTGWYFQWKFNDDYDYSNYYNTLVKKFNYDTVYTVQLIATNGRCADTVLKKNYVKVLPPFTQIQGQLNTCEGTRGDMVFFENSEKALQWKWNFGDGGTDSYSSFKDTIRHTYTKTGAYNVVLSTINGSCTVRDSVTAYVLLKQKPLLTFTKTDACGSDVLDFKLSGFEKHPYPYYTYYNTYYIANKQYGDLTNCSAYTTLTDNYWLTETSGTLTGLNPGKNDLRMITNSGYFGCYDTTNFIKIKVHGPAAGFKTETHSGCFKDSLLFTDTSKIFGNTAIAKWEWNFGDGKIQTLTGTSGSTKHLYAAPGYYYIRLKITDADGCISQTDYSLHYILVGGPKANFNASTFTVPPATQVQFYNTSSFYNDYYYNCTMQWIFSDGTTNSNDYPTFTYNDAGVFPVKLITKNTQTGCIDSIVKNITVRKVNSAFTYRLSYINSNACPPVIASFSSISTYAYRVSWNFGDGAVAGDQRNVSHTYNKPGLYRVMHYSYDTNIGVDSTEDFIEVKGPYALLKADTLSGCTQQQVTLTADVKYASDYTWDFGDGTVIPTTDTFAVHQYLTPGIYVPALILKDGGGCTATSELSDKIIIDSLHAAFSFTPPLICDSALTLFAADAKSLSNEQLQSPITYAWTIKQGAVQYTAAAATASFNFNRFGAHPVQLIVTSAFGCTQTVTDTVQVRLGVHPAIAGPNTLCQHDTATFKGTALPAQAGINWKWNLGNNTVSDKQLPPPQVYSSTGQKQVSLIVSNRYCSDTALQVLNVNPHPAVSFTPSSPYACLGSTIPLQASGGIRYQWFAATPITNGNQATINIAPAKGTTYAVYVTDAQGCSTKDSVFVKVIEPLTVKLAPTGFACEGSPVYLNADGADTYRWINYTTGLDNTGIRNPSALTATSATYTVVGYDNYNCFTDTAAVNIRISKLPLVNAGAGKEIILGMTAMLEPAVSGAINWKWQPGTYLNCTTCLNPVSKPASSITYQLTAYNADGCQASDTVTIHLLCKNNLVYIPNAFSPNNDGKNERLTITGSGVKGIQSIIIYNRWGKVLFERKNIAVNDRSNSWDGSFNGEPMPAGAYVYWIKTVCESGDIFDYRGTLMLLR